MIDTIRYRQPRCFVESASRRNWNIDAVLREVTDNEGFEDEQLRSVRGLHKKKGIHFFGNRDQIVRVQASLPRVLFGKNGKLLRSQADINAALRKLDRTLDRITHPSEEPRVFTRIDLVWHVPGRIDQFIAAHQHVRHPRVRNATCIYTGESIIWDGSSLRLMIYDKSKKESGTIGEFVRVEAQLHGHILDEFLEEFGPGLNFEECYHFFRRIVLQLKPASVTRVASIASLLAACFKGDFGEKVVNPAEAYLQELSPRRQRDLRREVAAFHLQWHSIDWSELLPVNAPSDPPELDDLDL